MLKSIYCIINDFTTLQVTGKQAEQFLQGQLTCDVKSLSIGHAIPTACCDHKGRVQFNGWVGKTIEDFILFLPTSLSQEAIQHLNKFAIFSKVTIVPLQYWSGLNYFGNEVPPLSKPNLIHGQIIFSETNGNMHWFIGSFEEIQQLVNSLQQTSQSINSAELNEQKILNRLVFVQPPTQGLFTPQMIELEKWENISFNKGCYVGQEVIAKTQYLGQLKRHLHSLILETALSPLVGQLVINTRGEQVGVIAASCQRSKGDWLVLAVIQDQALIEPIFYGDSLIFKPQ